MTNLLDFRYAGRAGEYHEATNVQVGDYVVITKKGYEDHNFHNLAQRVATGVTIGAVFPPLLIDGGIGIAGAAGEWGINWAGQAAIGGAVGGGVAYASRNDRNPLGFPKCWEGVVIMPFIGRVTKIDKRWWGQPGHDVEVKWFIPDEYGDMTCIKSYHNPSKLFKMERK